MLGAYFAVGKHPTKFRRKTSEEDGAFKHCEATVDVFRILLNLVHKRFKFTQSLYIPEKKHIHEKICLDYTRYDVTSYDVSSTVRYHVMTSPASITKQTARK